MKQVPNSAIRRLVDHHDGPTKTARLLADGFAYQLVQQWVDRGWASPLHFPKLAQIMPDGMSMSDLYADVEANKSARAAA